MLEQSIAKPPASPRGNKTSEAPRPSRIHFAKASPASAYSSRKNFIGCFCRHQKDESLSGSWKSSWK